jgi:hypothetical protein
MFFARVELAKMGFAIRITSPVAVVRSATSDTSRRTFESRHGVTQKKSSFLKQQSTGEFSNNTRREKEGKVVVAKKNQL